MGEFSYKKLRMTFHGHEACVLINQTSRLYGGTFFFLQKRICINILVSVDKYSRSLLQAHDQNQPIKVSGTKQQTQLNLFDFT